MIFRKKSEETPDEGTPAWMVTYGDMMGLLLTFFILIVSFSSIQESKFEQAAGSMRASLGILPESGKPQIFNELNRVSQERKMDDVIDNVQKMKAQVADKNLQGQVKITLTEKGAHIVIADPLLFDLGSDHLRPQAAPALDIVAEMLANSPEAEVVVEGHTDNWPIHNERFASNWELSSARALAVVKYFAFKKGLNPAMFSATGYGEYHPIKPNDTDENRAANRRVEIYVNMNIKFNVSETPPGMEENEL
jgi:chemotaxis protein MotB